MKSKWTYIVGIIVIVALAVAGGVYYYISNNHVATVSDEKISKAEYMFFLSDVKGRMEGTANLTDDNAKKTYWETNKIDGQSAIDVAKNTALENAKEFRIQISKAKQNKITLNDEDKKQIKSSIDNLIQSEGGKANAEKSLKSVYGITLDEYTKIFNDYMLMNRFIQDEQKKIQVTDDEVKKFYDENKSTLDKVTVKHILFTTKDPENNPLPEEKQAEVKKKAEDILAKVKAGEDMDALAKQYSEDPGSKDNGGEYTFGRGEMVKEFEDWSFNAKPGDTGIVKTDYGYHVMKFVKKGSFEDVKENVKSQVLGQKYTEKLDEWKKDPKFNIEINQKVFNSIKVI